MEGATSALLSSDGQMERTMWLLDPKVTHLACLSGLSKSVRRRKMGAEPKEIGREKRRECVRSSWEGETCDIAEC